MIRRFLLTAIILIWHIISYAQTISGRVTNEHGNPLEFVNVLLLADKDSSFVEGTVTREDGTYSFNVNRKDVLIMASFVGFKTTYAQRMSPNIILAEDQALLSDVSVTGSRIKNKPNGYSLRLAGTGLENANSVSDMMAFMPGMKIVENSISLLNKTPVIYVDGIRINTQDELSAILPKNIEKIEVDYLSVGEGANEKGGVIRISQKKEMNGGLSGFLREQVVEMPAYGHTKDVSTFSMNASLGKWSFSNRTLYLHHKLVNETKLSQEIMSTRYMTESMTKNSTWNNYISSRMNITYEINKKSSLAFSQLISNDDFREKQASHIKQYLLQGQEDVAYDELLFGPKHQLKYQTVGKYTLATDDKGSKLQITADYLGQDSHQSQYHQIENNVRNSFHTKELTDMLRLTARMTKRRSNGTELQTGTNYQYIHKSDADNRYCNLMNGHTTSAFLGLSGNKKNVMYSANMTIQYNAMNVETDGKNSSKEDFYLCPQGELMWMINPKKGSSLMLMLQRSIETMPYSAINGYKFYDDPTHYTTGNTALSTPYDDEMTLRFNVNRHLAFMFIYERDHNQIYYQHGVDADNPNISYSRPMNGDYEQMLVAMVEYTNNPAKWWRTKGEVSLLQVKSVTQEYNVSGKPNLQLRWNNNFNFNKTFGGSANAYWESGSSFQEVSWRPVGHFDISLWKTYFNDDLRLDLKSTLWRKGRYATTYSTSYISMAQVVTKETSFEFSATWNFRRGKKVVKRTEAESSQSYEMRTEKKQ